jgi:HlyD family secretion protein
MKTKINKLKNGIGLPLVVLVLAGTAVLTSCKSNKDTKEEWLTATVSKQDISDMVTCTGTLEPITTVDVGTQVSGRVDSIYVDYNSIVKKGQLLAELDQTVLSANLSSAMSALSTAKNELDVKEKNFQRYKTLYEKQLISASDYESAQYDYQKAKNDYTSSSNNYRTAQTNLGYAKIYSPIDGVVLSREVEEGQTVAASFSTPTLFTIANDLTKMRVIANVDEADMGNVQDGQRVVFTVDAYPYEEFLGTITQVRQSPTTTNNVVTYEVVVEAPNQELKLKPGMTATCTIYTLDRRGVLAVPTQAVNYKMGTEPVHNNDTVVWTLANTNEVAPRRVKTGSKNTSYTEILSGVSEGEKVIIGKTTVKEGGKTSSGQEEAKEEQQGESSPFMNRPPQRRR